jgi:hypothetical protein
VTEIAKLEMGFAIFLVIFFQLVIQIGETTLGIESFVNLQVARHLVDNSHLEAE